MIIYFNQKSAEKVNNKILIYYYNYFPQQVYMSRPKILKYSIRYINRNLQFFYCRGYAGADNQSKGLKPYLYHFGVVPRYILKLF